MALGTTPPICNPLYVDLQLAKQLDYWATGGNASTAGASVNTLLYFGGRSITGEVDGTSWVNDQPGGSGALAASEFVGYAWSSTSQAGGSGALAGRADGEARAPSQSAGAGALAGDTRGSSWSTNAVQGAGALSASEFVGYGWAPSSAPQGAGALAGDARGTSWAVPGVGGSGALAGSPWGYAWAEGVATGGGGGPVTPTALLQATLHVRANLGQSLGLTSTWADDLRVTATHDAGPVGVG